MKRLYFAFGILILYSCTASKKSGIVTDLSGIDAPVVMSNPVRIDKEIDLNFAGTENLIFVPENRFNPSSRTIAVHYFRFPAKEKTDLAPVFYLPGGPGGFFEEEHFYQFYYGPTAKAWTTELSIYNQKRDVIILNQRGNSNAPGFSIPNFNFRIKLGSKDEALNLPKLAIIERDAILKAVEEFKKEGIDPSGYDIINMVDDIEDIRRYYGYHQVALAGTSFGSQWALGYIQKYEHRVERALLSGIEPIDFARDDPMGIWNMWKRLAQYAENDSLIKHDLPEAGIIQAIKIILSRLSHKDVKVTLLMPGEIESQEVIIGPDDLKANLKYPLASNLREALEAWPKYISELYRGDYRLLALWALKERDRYRTELLLPSLIDNSVGISEERENLILSREELQWTGDFNRMNRMLRLSSPTRDAGPDFRRARKYKVPVLMIQGELDGSTPLANAYYLMQHLELGYLAEVKRGTHSAKRELLFQHPELAKSLFEFMNVDFKDQKFEEYTKVLPDTYELRSLEFLPIYGESLFDKAIKNLKSN